MSFTGEHDAYDDTSMTSDASCSSPRIGSNLSGLSGSGVNRSSSHSSSQPSKEKIAAENAEVLRKIIEIDAQSSERVQFVDKLKLIWEEFNVECNGFPNISKTPLDLFKLYLEVKSRGGFAQVLFFFKLKQKNFQKFKITFLEKKGSQK
jgi:hypothetical protein